MCLAVLGLVREIGLNRQALVDYEGIRLKIDLGLVEAAIGDTVLIHAGYAIAILDPLELTRWQEIMAEITEASGLAPFGNPDRLAGQNGQPRQDGQPGLAPR